MNDGELLHAFARQKSEAAFAELVRRHGKLVYSCARHRVGDPHAAEDITQSVFLALAIQAPKLSAGVALPGWLYRVTRFAAAKYQRREQHRREREMRASEHQQIHGTADDTATLWEEISPHLAEALDGLSAADREAVLLRFYEQANYPQIAETLRLSHDAARKRVDRALEQLRRFFTRKGVGIGTGALATVLSAHAAEAMPVAVAVQTVKAATAVAGGTAAKTSTLMLAKGALKAMFIAKVKTVSLAAAACLVVAGTGIVAAKQLNAPSPTPIQSPVVTASPKSAPVFQVAQAAPPAPAAPQSAPAGSKRKLSELVSITVENGKLVGRWIHPTPCEKLGEFATDNPPLRWAARAYPSQPAAPDSFWIDAVQTTGPAGQIGRFNLNASNERFWLSVGYGKNPQGWDVYIEYLQGRAPGETTKLWITDHGAKQNFEGADFAELRTKAGKEMREYLAPLFALFTNRDLLAP